MTNKDKVILIVIFMMLIGYAFFSLCFKLLPFQTPQNQYRVELKKAHIALVEAKQLENNLRYTAEKFQKLYYENIKYTSQVQEVALKLYEKLRKYNRISIQKQMKEKKND